MLLNLHAYERAARDRLPRTIFDYYAGGAEDEVTLADNVRAWERLRLRYRVLRAIDSVDLRTTLLGHTLALPVIAAPMAFQQLAHPDGELALRRATAAAGTLMTLSTVSTYPLEEVGAAADGPFWFQVYLYKDPALNRRMVARAEAAGCTALVLTVDTPVLGRRERDILNRFTLPPGVMIRNLLTPDQQTLPAVAGSGLAAYADATLKMSLGWDDVAWLSAMSKLPVLIKGIVHPADARLALAHGVAGIIVSNHGGRQLDGAPATIDALPAIADAVGGQLPLLIDGGIRRGSDIVKALALGASAVLVGRPLLWGLAVDGAAGAADVLALLRAELVTALTLCGCAALADVSAELLFRPV